MAGDSLEFRSFRSGDEAAVLRLLSGEKKDRFSLEEWAWSFPPEAAGRAIIVGEVGDRVAAVCAGVPTGIVVDGRSFAALEIRKVAAPDPDGLRAVVENFVETAKSSGRFDLAVTALDLDPAVLVGFESARRERSVKLSRHRPGVGGLRRLFYRAEPARDWEPRLVGLWARLTGSYPVALMRDADGWLQRFAGHPTRRHHRFLVCRRYSREAVAAAVFVDENSRCRWLDLIWDHDHPGALELLSHISGRLARQFDSDAEELWMAGDDEAVDLLTRWKFEKRAAPSFVAAASFDPQIDARDIVERFYLTSADLGVDEP